MRNFHLTHIAVTLLLIVSLAVQPLAVCLAGVACASGCSEPPAFSCPGCGCCDVEGAGDRCCCCSGSAQTAPAETAEPSCCSRKHREPQASDSSRNADEASATSITPVEPGLRSNCLCEQAPPPLSDSSPRQTTSESRDTLALASDLDDAVLGRERLLAASHYVTSVPPTHRFSQVVLCIWRL